MDDTLKRFTDTGKWEDKWFRALTPTTKLLWSWLLDHCDNAGVIDPDTELASFQIGDTIKESHFTELADRIQTLPNGKRWIPKFIRFQFGTLGPESRVHASVIKLLKVHNIEYPMDTLSIGYVNGINTPKDKDKDKVQDSKGESEGELVEKIYKAFPLHVGKPAALKAIRGALSRGNSPQMLLEKSALFAASRHGDMAYCPHPSTWFNQDRFNDDPETWKPRNDTTAKPLPPSHRDFGMPTPGSKMGERVMAELRARGDIK